MTLKSVYPENYIPGFEVEIFEFQEPLVRDADFCDSFVDHYLLVTILNTGNNYQYSQSRKTRVLISQLTKKENLFIETTGDDLIIVLEPEHRLQAIKVCEMHQSGKKEAVLIVMVKDTSDQSTHTCVFGLQSATNTPLQ